MPPLSVILGALSVATLVSWAIEGWAVGNVGQAALGFLGALLAYYVAARLAEGGL